MRTSIKISLRLIALLVCFISCQATLERENEGNNMANVSYHWVNYFKRSKQIVESHGEIMHVFLMEKPRTYLTMWDISVKSAHS